MTSTTVAEFDGTTQAPPSTIEFPARTAFRTAVAEVADKARAVLPQCNGRIEKAVSIVLAGDVELLDDGTAKVASQSHGTTKYFVVNGACECPDFSRAPSGMCKHRLAYGIAKRATTLGTQKLEAMVGATPADEPAPAPVSPLPEAPVSITIKGTINGQDVMVTVRGTDLPSVWQQVTHASTRLDTPEALPRCATHGVALQKHRNTKGTWYSHKLDDGSWCKGT